MRAVEVGAFGGPDVLRVVSRPDPVPGPDQVLVDVAYAAVVFVDSMTRAGVGPVAGRLTPPFVLGNGVGGTVLAAGPGVDPAVVGRRVVTPTGGTGGYASRALAPAPALVPVPDGLPLDVATALLADGRTAVLLTRLARPAAGERVLVEAAGGGLGVLLTQLAVRAGARVIGAAGGAPKRELARRMGAELVVDYRDPQWTDEVRAATGGVDLVYESVGGAVGTGALGLLVDGGRLAVFGFASGAPVRLTDEDRRRVRVLGMGWSPEEQRAASVAALELATAGRLTPVIGQRYPLDRAADAHRAIEARTTVGKTLLVP